MLNETVTVTFSLLLDNSEEVDEQELGVNFDSHCVKLSTQDNYEGVIKISSSCESIVRVEDDLLALVKNLCFLTIPDLIANKNFVYRYYDHYGYLRLDPEGDLLLISGDDNPTIRVPLKDFLIALYNCGQRFISFLVRLKDCDSAAENNTSIENAIHFLEEQRKIADSTIVLLNR